MKQAKQRIRLRAQPRWSGRDPRDPSEHVQVCASRLVEAERIAETRDDRCADMDVAALFERRVPARTHARQRRDLFAPKTLDLPATARLDPDVLGFEERATRAEERSELASPRSIR